MPDWERIIAGAARKLEDQVDALKDRVGDRTPDPRAGDVRIAAYRGYGTADLVHVGGRVLAGPPIPPPDERDAWWRNFLSTYRRMESDEVPGARVTIRVLGATHEALTDEEGYFRAWIRPETPLPDGRLWQNADLRLGGPDADAAPTGGFVLTPLPSARFGVISDLDDTVLRTDATSLFRMLRGVLFTNARTRLPFDGVASFYQALHGGSSGRELNPIFYVSSSPWNLYDLLTDFLAHQDIPLGPLMLRDWGISEELVLAPGHRRHKLGHIRQILDCYPELPFLLLGDSGQEDPEIYKDIIAEYPGRILAAYIRDVSPSSLRRAAIDALTEQVRAEGGSLILADDTLAVARHAHEHGWITAEAFRTMVAEAAGRGGGNGAAVVVDGKR